MSHPSNRTWTIAECVELACRLEATAPKAGNVHPGAGFVDMTYADFVASAVAVAPVFEHATQRGVGRTVLEAIERRRRAVPVNTNLGIVLLLAPLAAVPRGTPLASGINDVLEHLTVADADAVYRAIRIAGAGGLGTANAQDVRKPPSETLLEVMRRAAERDLVARQYAQRFDDVLDCALPILVEILKVGMPLDTAIVHMHLTMLTGVSDTLILRKCGLAEAKEASRRAGEVIAAGWPAHSAEPHFRAFDAWLREKGHTRNPGSTADLVTAALFAGLREGIITVPAEQVPEGMGFGPE